MPGKPDLVTYLYADFAGRRRKLVLTIGGIGELERLCQTGIGAIALRLAAHAFHLADVRETIRLALEGEGPEHGGLSEVEATALVMRYIDGRPLATYLQLACDIINAVIAGLPPPEQKKSAADAPVT